MKPEPMHAVEILEAPDSNGPHDNRHRRAGRNRDLEHTYERVFKDYPMTLGRGLHRVVAVGEIRFILSVNVIVPGKEDKAAND